MGADPSVKSWDTFDSPQLIVMVFIFNEFSRGISLARPEVDRSELTVLHWEARNPSLGIEKSLKIC
jgi:hypothetical protein